MFSGAESYKENALENKWVLSLFLNVLTLGAVLMSMGSSFQRKGAAAENERRPYEENFQAAVRRSCFLDERREREDEYGWIKLRR